MASSQTIPLRELIEPDRGISYGIVQPGSHCADGIPIIRVSDVKNGTIQINEPLRVSHEIEAKYLRTRLRGDELIITIVGSVGQTAIVPKSLAGWNVARAIAVLPIRSEIGPYWVQLALQSPSVQSRIDTRLNTTVQATLNLGDIAELPILVPPTAERDRIASILRALDDKIELNRRMNEMLDAMVRALFKNWFVDFGPTRAKQAGMEPYLAPESWSLFPERLDAEGKPEGWRMAAIGDLCRRIAMGPFGSDIKKDHFINSGVPVVRGSNLTKGFVEDSFVFVSEAKANELRNANAFPGDIVITHRGTLGQVGLIPESSLFPRYVVSQSQMLLAINQDVATSRYIYGFLISPMGQHALLANTSQTGVPAIARPTASVRAIKIIVPPIEALKLFDALVAPLYERANHGINESRTLAQLRDLLLPKLMSGEIRIKDAETLAEAIL